MDIICRLTVACLLYFYTSNFLYKLMFMRDINSRLSVRCIWGLTIANIAYAQSKLHITHNLHDSHIVQNPFTCYVGCLSDGNIVYNTTPEQWSIYIVHLKWIHGSISTLAESGGVHSDLFYFCVCLNNDLCMFVLFLSMVVAMNARVNSIICWKLP